MKTTSRIRFEVSYVRGNAEIEVFHTYSWQAVPVLVNRCAKALLCFTWSGHFLTQKDYLKLTFYHEERNNPVREEVAHICLNTDGKTLLWY